MKRAGLAAAALATLMFATAGMDRSAQADIPHSSFYVGLYGGFNIVTGDWDLFTRSASQFVQPDSSPSFGLRLGVMANEWLGFELAVGALPYDSSVGVSGIALNYGGDVLFHLATGDWVPVLSLGGGGYHNLASESGNDLDLEGRWGLALRGMLADWVALRIDAKHHLTDGVTEMNHNIEITGGFDFFAWVEDHTPPDTDMDGIPDADDACPTVKGVPSAGGCPDMDGDGIKDSDDKCPKRKGPAKLQGCPDSDDDGIVDDDDSCPNAAGPIALGGCPDSDGDGIADKDDRCPNRPGIKTNWGCPKVEIPKEVLDQFSGAIEGIYFKSGSAVIRDKSFPVLNNAVTILAKYRTIKVSVEGHTDSRGSDKSNKALSEARAQSVRQYLVDKGIEGDRLTAVGYGEEKPVASNKKKSGRAQNRRIEFRITAK